MQDINVTNEEQQGEFGYKVSGLHGSGIGLFEGEFRFVNIYEVR